MADTNNINFDIIIIQASGDVLHGLNIIQNHKNPEFVIVLVINVENIYDYLNSLNLNIFKILFIPYLLVNFRNPYTIIKEKIRLQTYFKRYFSKLKVRNVTFFSKYEDWLTGFFLHNFNKYNNILINYCPYYDNSDELHIEINTSIKRKLYLYILKFITNVDFVFKYANKFPEFPINNYPNILLKSINLTPVLNKRYLFKIKDNPHNSALFLLSNCDNTIFDPDSFFKIVNSTFKNFENKNFKIYLKGHPRLGLPNEFLNNNYTIIPSFIPSECLELNNFKYIIGIESYSLCYFARQNKEIICCSLMNLIKSNSFEKKSFFMNYLEIHSNNNIFFPHSSNFFDY